MSKGHARTFKREWIKLRDNMKSTPEESTTAEGAPDAPAEGAVADRDVAAEREAGATACPLCFEQYDSEEPGHRVPRLLKCGHSACQGCYAKMLEPIVQRNGVKRLECPECRVEMQVNGGQASNRKRVMLSRFICRAVRLTNLKALRSHEDFRAAALG